MPGMRIPIVRRDKRWRGADPVPAPPGEKTLTREQVAVACGVSTRTVTRYADTGVLTKYLDILGRVVFLAAQVDQVATARQGEGQDASPPVSPSDTQPARPRRRW